MKPKIGLMGLLLSFFKGLKLQMRLDNSGKIEDKPFCFGITASLAHGFSALKYNP